MSDQQTVTGNDVLFRIVDQPPQFPCNLIYADKINGVWFDRDPRDILPSALDEFAYWSQAKPTPVAAGLREAVEKAVRTYAAGPVMSELVIKEVVADVAPLLAAKDAEIARLNDVLRGMQTIVDSTQPTIDDLRAQLVAVTRERDEARICLGGFRETVRRISGERDDLCRVAEFLFKAGQEYRDSQIDNFPPSRVQAAWNDLREALAAYRALPKPEAPKS